MKIYTITAAHFFVFLIFAQLSSGWAEEISTELLVLEMPFYTRWIQNCLGENKFSIKLLLFASVKYGSV